MHLLSLTYRITTIIKTIFYKIIFGKKIKIGEKTHFRKRFNIVIEKKGTLEIGKRCFFNNDCSINVLENIQIGDDTLFGENVKLYDHNHVFKYNDKLIKEQGFKTEKIKIGNNCWIGSNVAILKGITIGDNTVIGIGCIIKQDIPRNSIVKGKDFNIEIHDINYENNS